MQRYLPRQTSLDIMAWLIKISVLLTVLIRTTHTVLDIRTEEESYDVYIPNDGDYCLVFRSSAEKNRLLWNSSNPLNNSTPDGEFKDRLKLTQKQNSSYLRINSLAQSDSGQYRTECWRDGRMSHQNISDLSVCRELGKTSTLYANPGETVSLHCNGTRDGDNTTVRWFQRNTKNMEMVLLSSSSLLITNISMEDIWYMYYICINLNGHLCVSRQTLNPQIQTGYVVLSVGEEAVLPCFNYDDPNGTETRWRTSRFGDISWDSGESQAFLSDGRQTGNYSLVIPSLRKRHSGLYFCYDQLHEREKLIKGYKLLVCLKTEPLTEFFSEGEEVVLRCKSNLTESDRVVWYRQTAHGNCVILDTEPDEQANLPKDLDGRVNASNPPYYLVLSNLSLADSGEYWCAVFYERVCVSVTKTVLVEWDPFGINSTFYRVYSSLMACALLGMVCVLITVNLKTRRRDQASLKTRRTAAQRRRSSRLEEEEGESDEGRGEKKESEEEK
ncbi:hypothetical protein DPEC_G00274700 [Dallia pectoralis]|uniref:Uncharacterized protein n=1 Tax=Dallia pectoralis TaxID=75939 RepID=A0ACC2FL23_DALPE|nr:hypothetical protein DPEC_G00274700 [Dallia pectoralis]